jgi:O-antigen ligase
MKVRALAAEFSIYAFVFCHPILPRLLGLLAVLMVALNLLRWVDVKPVFKKRHVLLMSSFFLVNVAGLLWTTHLDEGAHDLERKLTLLIFPLTLIPFFPTLDQRVFRKLKLVLVASIVLTAIGLLIRATNLYYIEYFDNIHGVYREFHYYHGYFFSNILSPLVHPSYQALYSCVALIFLFEYRRSLNFILFAFTYLFIAIFIFLLASKAGMLSFGLIALVHAIAFFRAASNKKTVLLFFGLLLISAVIIIGTNGEIRNRFLTVENYLKTGKPADPTESTYSRAMAWKAAGLIISEHPLAGVGTGDVQEHLNQKYGVLDFPYGIERNLNCHNQYLESYTAVGLLGIVTLLILIFYPLISGRTSSRNTFTRPSLTLVLFIAVIVLNFAVESMLETQAGILFFAFFQTILLVERLQLRKEITEHAG